MVAPSCFGAYQERPRCAKPCSHRIACAMALPPCWGRSYSAKLACATCEHFTWCAKEWSSRSWRRWYEDGYGPSVGTDNAEWHNIVRASEED